MINTIKFSFILKQIITSIISTWFDNICPWDGGWEWGDCWADGWLGGDGLIDVF